MKILKQYWLAIAPTLVIYGSGYAEELNSLTISNQSNTSVSFGIYDFSQADTCFGQTLAHDVTRVDASVFIKSIDKVCKQQQHCDLAVWSNIHCTGPVEYFSDINKSHGVSHVATNYVNKINMTAYKNTIFVTDNTHS